MTNQPHTRTTHQAPPIVTHTTPPPFIVRQHPTVPRHYQPTVIEKTGKAFKTWMLIGGGMAMLGGVFVLLGSFAQSAPVLGIGMAIGVFGVGTWLVARVMAWWNHG